MSKDDSVEVTKWSLCGQVWFMRVIDKVIIGFYTEYGGEGRSR